MHYGMSEVSDPQVCEQGLILVIMQEMQSTFIR